MPLLKDYFRLLFKELESHERIDAFLRIEGAMREPHRWAVFGLVWMRAETLYASRSSLDAFLRRGPSPFRRLMMDREDRMALARMPERIKVWRGCWAGNLDGWSWSLDRRKAEWFAHRYPVDGKPLLAAGEVARDEVVAFVSGRGESEIVADPAKVRGRRVRALAPGSNPTARAFHLVQAGAIADAFDPEIVEARILSMRRAGVTRARIEAQIAERAAFVASFGLGDLAGRWSSWSDVVARVYGAEGGVTSGS